MYKKNLLSADETYPLMKNEAGPYFKALSLKFHATFH